MATIADTTLLVLEFVADYVIRVAALGLLVYTMCAITFNSQRLRDVLVAVSPAPFVGFLPAILGLKGALWGLGVLLLQMWSIAAILTFYAHMSAPTSLYVVMLSYLFLIAATLTAL